MAAPKDESSIDEVDFYPNPVSNLLAIKVPESIQSIEIRNIEGRIVYQSTLLRNSKTIDVTNLKSGLYLISFIDLNGKRIEKKMVKD